MIGSTEAVPIRPVEQAALFGAETERVSGESEAGHEVEQLLSAPTAYRAVSPLSGAPLNEVCASCGNEVLPPGFVIPDFEELGAFCDEACGDQRFRRFLEETFEDCRTADEGQHL